MISTCQYLFNKSAKELFPDEDEVFIEESLQAVITKVDELLVSRRESLFLFDPAAFNDQCHLYALFAAQGTDRKYLYLSFFLSKAFMLDATLMEKVVGAKDKKLKRLLKDPEGIRARAARVAMNRLFEEHLKATLPAGELAELANEDLQHMSSDKKGLLYTFPKFAGVHYFNDAVAQDKIPILFKVKVVTQEGNGYFSFSEHDLKALDPKAPVIVFELIATGEGISFVKCRDIALRCFFHSRRNVMSKDRHKADEVCLFCSEKRVDVSGFRDKFLPILARKEEMLLALGADFVLQKQKQFLAYFEKGKYPKLAALFDQHYSNIQKLFLSMTDPFNLSVAHVYTDCVSEAVKENMILDAPYSEHLQKRGLV
ncbi:MAG: hypothetical protein JSS30_03485 [Verrucomicrobia bacterium]|nr:hypothetical protein [Verrucomicrobiota bacterium]